MSNDKGVFLEHNRKLLKNNEKMSVLFILFIYLHAYFVS